MLHTSVFTLSHEEKVQAGKFMSIAENFMVAWQEPVQNMTREEVAVTDKLFWTHEVSGGMDLREGVLLQMLSKNRSGFFCGWSEQREQCYFLCLSLALCCRKTGN